MSSKKSKSPEPVVVGPPLIERPGAYIDSSEYFAIVETVDGKIARGRVWTPNRPSQPGWWETWWSQHDGKHHNADYHDLKGPWPDASPPSGCTIKPQDVRWFPHWVSRRRLTESERGALTIEISSALLAAVRDGPFPPLDRHLLPEVVDAVVDRWTRENLQYKIVGRTADNELVARPVGADAAHDFNLKQTPQQFGLDKLSRDEKLNIGLR